MGLLVLVFLTVSLGIVAGYQLLSDAWSSSAQRVRQRIVEEFGSRGQSASSQLFKNPDQLTLDPGQVRLDPVAEVPLLSQAARGLLGGLQTIVTRANVGLTLQQLVFLAGACALVLGIAGTLAVGWLVGVLAALGAAALPWIYVHFRAGARHEKYLRQLPNAFDLMARVIRAGQPVPQALQSVADAFEEPLAGEFANCQKQQTLGLRPEVTFQELAQRSGILEMRIFAMAMLIQRQTGGNLSDVLERLAGLVRSRLRLRQHVRTLTAEGRLQGWTLVVLPFLVFAAMLVLNRSYAEVLFEHMMLLVGTAISMVIGIWWIRRIVNFEC